ncbi:MAG: hypothetical protein DIU78_009745 [Pseudomonadota bacterium]|nr:MAG: hypothetical protein DIU78_07560 [Pseudomonadota bacterium]
MTRQRFAVLFFAAFWCACEPQLTVGAAACLEAAPLIGPEEGGDPIPSLEPVEAWATSFESGFCDYRFVPGGFCYRDADSEYGIVEWPVRSGRRAAAFSVTSDPDLEGMQARCVREGILPEAAYYGAWYYIPDPARNEGNWNLFHFQGGDDLHGLWDVSLASSEDGQLSLYIYDFLRRRFRRPAEPRPVPIASWFHVELYLRRSADETGAVALYQDGQLLWEANELITDDSEWGQWYLGNLADALSPETSTLYVDDVTIRPEP